MLVLLTDYGVGSPYVGLLRQAIHPFAPDIPVLDLCHDLPLFDAQAAAYFLAGYVPEFPPGTVFVCVVDPGVGSDRRGLIVAADDRFFVGPENGILDRIIARAAQVRVWEIIWRSTRLSATFHGRDVFAPVAAQLAVGTATPDELGDPIDIVPHQWPDDLARVVHIDRFGNLITGIRFSSLGRAEPVMGAGVLELATTFSDVSPGEAFYYNNSSGLLEIAVNRGSAALHFGVDAGDSVELKGEPLRSIRVR